MNYQIQYDSEVLSNLRKVTPILEAGRSMYIAISNGVNSLIALTLFTIVLIPLNIALIYFYFFKVCKKSKKTINISKDNYSAFRQEFEDLKSLITRIDNIQKINYKTLPFLLRPTIFIIGKILNVIKERKQNLASQLDLIENQFPKSDANIFIPVFGDDLWSKRTKAYSYRF